MSDQTIGEKIRNYRTQRQFSQLDLETEAGMANGSVSRIEHGSTNPTKETIADIALALKLNAHEIANLYGIDDYNPAELIKAASKLFKSKDISELAKNIVDDLIFKLGYIASAFFIVKDGYIITKGITKTHISEVTFELLGDIPIENIKWDVNETNPSKLVEVVINKEPLIVPRDSDYLYPALTKEVADLIQEKTGDDKTLLYPVKLNDIVIAILAIASKVHTDFENDMPIIESVSEQICLAMENLNR